MKTIKIIDMNSPDISEAMDQGFDSIVIAVGAIEQHGPHLPLKTDSLIGEEMVHIVAKKLGEALQGPTINVGCSEHHMEFPGTVSIAEGTLKSIISDYTRSFVKHGFKNIIFIPSHGGNFAAVGEAIEKLQEQYPDNNIIGYTDLPKYIEIIEQISIEAGITVEEAGAHAGENETSIMLALAENLVKTERFEPGYVGKFGEKEIELVFSKGMKALTANGIIGDPAKANWKNGKIYLQKICDFLVSEIKKQM
ncbi:MAG: creatininase family protein [Candidatus Heimdallarchaeota archaeon]